MLGVLKRIFGGAGSADESPREQSPTGVPFSFLGKDYTDPVQLVRALVAHPAEALPLLTKGTIDEWVTGELRQPVLGDHLDRLATDEAIAGPVKLDILELALDPATQPTWEGEALSAEWVAQSPEKAFAVLQSGYGYWADRLRKTTWFKTFIPEESKLNVAGRDCVFKAVPWTGVQICTTIVTRGQWREFVRQTGWNKSAEWEAPAFDQTDEHPVVNVSWHDVNEFCAWFSQLQKRKYRLPTDDEWSKAAGDTKYPYGNHHPPTAKEGIYSTPVARLGTAPVATCRPNFLGLYDMGGNVWEWSLNAPKAEPNFRILRGASWYHKQRGYLQSSRRPYAAPEERGDNYGFRIVLVVKGE